MISATVLDVLDVEFVPCDLLCLVALACARYNRRITFKKFIVVQQVKILLDN